MHRLDITLNDLFPPHINAQYTERSGGMHVSDIVRDLCARLEPKRFPAQIRVEGAPPMPQRTNPRWELGMAFEDQLGERLADRHCRLYSDTAFRPGEITVDDITGTPDWIEPCARILDEDTKTFFDGPAVVEAKCTWLTSRHEIEGGKFTYWIWQGKSYCYMHQVPTLRIFPLHIMGDYLFEKSPEPGPHFLGWEETYTARELQEHWDMIRKHRDKMLRERIERG
jgi:hypothetical protein